MFIIAQRWLKILNAQQAHNNQFINLEKYWNIIITEIIMLIMAQRWLKIMNAQQAHSIN
jgi:hypothetical protein